MNKVIIIGNVTRDVELKQTAAGVSVARISVAVNRRMSGEQQVDYFNVVAWRALAENCEKYLSKGRKIAVLGSLQTRTYEGNDGVKRLVTEINADEIEFLSPADSVASHAGHRESDDEDLPF